MTLDPSRWRLVKIKIEANLDPDLMADVAEQAAAQYDCCEVTVELTPCLGVACEYESPMHGLVIHNDITHQEGCPVVLRRKSADAGRKGLN